jgi:hypothetical protein
LTLVINATELHKSHLANSASQQQQPKYNHINSQLTPKQQQELVPNMPCRAEMKKKFILYEASRQMDMHHAMLQNFRQL